MLFFFTACMPYAYCVCTDSAVLQLVGAAVVLCAFNWYAAAAQPFLHSKEAELDGTLR
jgi:hypothetical protein